VNPITHFLAGWVGLEKFVPSMRDKGLIAVAGVLPDIDGLGIGVDVATRALGLPPSDLYQQYHRMLAHGLPAALVFSVLLACFARRPRSVFAFALVAVHLHFLCDIVGSRGSTASDLWSIYYFAPVALSPELFWSGQWPLVGWQNTAITAILLFAVLLRSAVSGYSPVGLVSAKGDGVLSSVAQRWFGALVRRR
jgi:inner membrane protein